MFENSNKYQFMNIKNNKGITGVDVTVAIVIVTMFTALIANMFYNVETSKKELVRASQATEIAIKTIEEIKQMNYSELPESETATQTIEELNRDLNEKFAQNGYSIEVEIQNYKDIKGDDTLNDFVKQVKVKVRYTSNEKERNVEITTAIVNNG